MDINKRDQWLNNQRSGSAGAAQPVKAKHFTANFSDLSGPTNPTGIWSPAFLMLKQALDNGDEPDNVLQALEGWLCNKKSMPSSELKPGSLERILDLPTECPQCKDGSPENCPQCGGSGHTDAVYDALIGLIYSKGGKLANKVGRNTLPPLVQQTLRRAIQRIAQRHIERGQQNVDKEQARLSGLRQRYGVESAPKIVRHLLAS